MRRYLLLTLLTIGSFTIASAQSLDMFRKQIQQPDSVTSARVRVTEHDDAASAVRSMQVQPTGAKIRGYRVRIFFDNSQSSRSRAEAAFAKFKETYPTVPAYIKYEAPYFKVTVGNCVTAEEAIILWGRIKGVFDRAFIINGEEIPLTALGAIRTPVAIQ